MGPFIVLMDPNTINLNRAEIELYTYDDTGLQPFVRVRIAGTVGYNTKTQSNFDIQTTASQRNNAGIAAAAPPPPPPPPGPTGSANISSVTYVQRRFCVLGDNIGGSDYNGVSSVLCTGNPAGFNANITYSVNYSDDASAEVYIDGSYWTSFSNTDGASSNTTINSIHNNPRSHNFRLCHNGPILCTMSTF
jgi:hypothetical protein